MESIKEITKKLFDVDWDTLFLNDALYDAYEAMAKELIKNNDWKDVYACWYDYLINECKTQYKVVSFENLFLMYDGDEHPVPNAAEFAGYLYANVSLDEYWYESDTLDGLTRILLQNSGLISDLDFTNNMPSSEYPIIKDAIKKWREKGCYPR